MANVLEIILKATDKASKEIQEVSTKLGGLGAVGGAIVGTVGAGIAAAGVAAGAFMVSTIGPASDLAETIGKVGVVFGDQSGEVRLFAINAARSLGMTESAALAAAGTYGNLFRAMGITEEVSADMSTELVQLAADLASFNNIDPTVALDKLRAGLSGETEPLRTLGVNLNQVAIEAKAMEMALWDGEGTISAAAKAQASYALILEQTSLAQGDFERTSQGLANQQRILKATFGDIQASVGTALLPILTTLANKISEFAASEEFQSWLTGITDSISEFALSVVEWIPQAIEWFKNMVTWFQENQPIVIGVLAAMGVAVAAFAFNTIVALAPMIAAFAPVIAIMAAVGAAVYLLYRAWTENWGGIQQKLQAVWAFILPIFQTVKAWLQVNIPIAIQALTNFWTNVLLPAIEDVWTFIQNDLVPLFKALWELLSAAGEYAIRVLTALWENVLLPALKSVWSFIQTNILPIFQALIDKIKGPLGEAFNWLKTKVLDPVSAAFGNISGAISTVIGWAQRAAEAFSKINVPKIFQPGSPTPFEMGLRGISAALKDLSAAQLPEFNAQLNVNRTGPMGAGAAATQTQGRGGNEYHLHIHTAAPTENIMADFAVLQALAG